MWRRVELLALGRVDELAGLDSGVAGPESPVSLRSDDPAPLTASEWDDALADYEDEYGEVPGAIATDGDARNPALLRIDTDPDPADTGFTDERRTWLVHQILEDPQGDRDWRVEALVDLDASDASGELVLWAVGFDPTS